ncbi:hypothetical protein CC2G_001480 [Coprinopsis cinerea AmutBmut pab1-1]|nr:hypothetical protein CC2G_001480 [Coprinopsis cinerea AmutBmut pab1-1]KAG2023874.1 hypothetical protein CC2G_001480 [Coprinopsis cinerea AmutBmut pab1-1]
MAAALTLARVYQHSFDTHPNVTLAVTGGCLNALGDCVAQVSERTMGTRKETDQYRAYDIARTFRFFCYGFAISPFLGRWNAFLETRFPLQLFNFTRGPTYSRNLRTLRTRGGWTEETIVTTTRNIPKEPISWVALTKRVAADQLFMAPLGLVLFIGSMGIMEGRTPRQIGEKYKDIYADAIVANWKVWPLAQLINFRFMPLPYRVPFSQTCGVFWTLYLSLLNSREDAKQDRRVHRQRLQEDWRKDSEGRIHENEAQSAKIL